MAVEPVNQFRDVARIYDSLMAAVPYRHWVDYVERLWERFGGRPHRVLDLACGTGNVALELLRRGYEVDGVDASAEMLRQARRKARGRIVFYHQDARQLNLPRCYEACVCLFDSLNYLLEWEDLVAAFAGVRRHLEPGGTFVFDLNAIRALADGMFDQQGFGRDRRVYYLWRSRWDPETRRCQIEMQFHHQTRSGSQVYYERHVQRGYELTEVLAALSAGGLEPLAAFEAFTFDPPTARTDRYYFVARRPAG